MGSWEKEKSCHHKIIAISLFIYWLGALYSNWEVALAVFPGLFLVGFFLFSLIPKGVIYINNYLNKCKHGTFGGETLNKCKICLKDKAELERKNALIADAKQKFKQSIEASKKKKELRKKEYDKLRISEINSIRELYNLKFENLININPLEFERLVGKLYEKLGYTVIVTNKSNDGGRDLILFRDNEKIIVECKKYNIGNIIGRPIIQKFHSAVITDKAIKGILVTTSDFNKNVYQHPSVQSGQIELVNRSKLKTLLIEAFGEINPESFQNICLTCGDIYQQGFSRIDYCKNGHRGEYITLEDFIK